MKPQIDDGHLPRQQDKAATPVTLTIEHQGMSQIVKTSQADRLKTPTAPKGRPPVCQRARLHPQGLGVTLNSFKRASILSPYPVWQTIRRARLSASASIHPCERRFHRGIPPVMPCLCGKGAHKVACIKQRRMGAGIKQGVASTSVSTRSDPSSRYISRREVISSSPPRRWLNFAERWSTAIKKSKDPLPRNLTGVFRFFDD